MRRIFSDYAYGPGPRDNCWWDETIAAPDWPRLTGDIQVDVAVIGGGFTGMSAALHLAQSGLSVAVIEAGAPGWGASGRNGGFCCLGGSKLGEKTMIRRYGADAARGYHKAEVDAVNLVADLLKAHAVDADTHSQGETQLAHRRRDMDRMRRTAEAMVRDGEPVPTLIEAADLPAHGLNGPFHGALTTPVGFALNPRKYLFGLAKAAQSAGALLFAHSPASAPERAGSGWQVATTSGRVRCDKVAIATNGYSSDDTPAWLAGRYLPTQSNIMVTRPLSDAELGAQGWTSDQAAYDTRHLLHYFRLMPDRRFLFGMRGGLMASSAAEAQARRRTRRDFDRMFPAWRDVATEYAWSGFVCLSRRLHPFVAEVEGMPGVLAGMAYHGNGVAMGSFTGKMLATLARTGQHDPACPQLLRLPPTRFPLGRWRRALVAPAYLGFALRDL